MTRKQTVIITLLTITAIILALLVSSRFWVRLDLTKNKAYTISEVSRNLYREINDPVDITYYISDKLRTIVPAPGEIEDMLMEYAAFSRGRIRLTVRDPVKAGVADVIEEIGLMARKVPVVEQDQTSLITVYSGVVIEYLDRIDILPWVISTETLEYDLTSRIRSMARDSERLIGIIIGDSYRTLGEDFSYLYMTFINAGYNVRLFQPGEEIPDSLPGLFVLGGAEELDDWALYRIDRYIQMGGKVFFAVKGIYVDTIYGTMDARHQEDLGLLAMIDSYGVVIRPELALDRSALTMQYQHFLSSGVYQIRMTRYPLWIGVLGENGNQGHPVSSGFSGLDLYWASPLEIHSSAAVQAVPLFSSTQEAWAMRYPLITAPDVSYMLELEAAETRGGKILGASLSGVFPGFFRGAPKPVREGSQEELPDMPERASPSRIIVVGDVDFASNIMSATDGWHNLDFLVRVADFLVNDEDIIGIRNRQPQAGRFDRIQNPERRAAAMRFAQILNVFIVPALIITAGLFRASKRSRNIKTESIKENSDDI